METELIAIREIGLSLQKLIEIADGLPDPSIAAAIELALSACERAAPDPGEEISSGCVLAGDRGPRSLH